jgi:hypothetical protein
MIVAIDAIEVANGVTIGVIDAIRVALIAMIVADDAIGVMNGATIVTIVAIDVALIAIRVVMGAIGVVMGVIGVVMGASVKRHATLHNLSKHPELADRPQIS